MSTNQTHQNAQDKSSDINPTRLFSCSKCQAEFRSRGLRDGHSRKCNPTSTVSLPHPQPMDAMTQPVKMTVLPKVQYREGNVQSTSDNIYSRDHWDKDNLPSPLRKGSVSESGEEEYASSPPATSDQDEYDLSSSEDETGSEALPLEQLRTEPGLMNLPIVTGKLNQQLQRIPYLDQLGIVINTTLHCFCCTICQVALTPDSVLHHLKHSHGYLKSLLDMEQLKAIAEGEGIMNTLPEIATAEALDPFEGLKIHQGFQCSLCHSFAGTQGSMRTHHSRSHKDQPIPKSWKSCFLQRLTTHGKEAAFFQVHGPSKHQVSEAKIIRKIHIDLANILTVNIKPANSRNISPWLLSTRWHEHVQPYNAGELLKLIKVPVNDELKELKELVTSYMKNAYGLIKHTSELTLQKLNTADPQKGGINNIPFHQHQQNSTLTTYITPVFQMLAFLIRPKKNYQIPLPEDVTRRLEILSKSVCSEASQDEKILALHNVFMGLWKQKWSPTVNNKLPCPTIRALALMTMKPDGGFLEPKDVTMIIARLEYNIRLAMLYEIKKISAENFDGSDELACDQVQPWFIEKVDSPFNSLRSLQHRASSLVYQTMSPPRIWWTDRVHWTQMLYKGHSLHIDQVRNLFAMLKDLVIMQWEEKVLCGLGVHVEYDFIADDLTCNDVRYSFLVDPRNHVFKQRDQLLHAILKNSGIRSQFIEINKETGDYIWNRNSLHRWLHDYAHFQALQLIRAEMLGGSPGRIMELSSMNYCSTELRPVRNLFALDKHIALMRTYTKTSSLTHVDKLIPHSLDAITADLMVQDLAIARPFAEIAIRVCYPEDGDIHRLYEERLFVNNLKEFDSTFISRLMVDISMPIVGFQLSVNPWRHICIAWRNKLCPEFTQLLEEGDDMETIGALQTGHRRKTEIRVYSLSADALVGPAEDILPLYLDCSVGLQKQFHVAPGGLMIPYSKAAAYSPSCHERPDMQSTENTVSEDRIVNKILNALGEQLQERIVEGVVERILKRLDSSTLLKSQNSTTKSNSQIHPTISSISFPTSRQHSERLKIQCLDVLRTLIKKPDATWTCQEQWRSLEEICKLQRDVLAIMRTGSGKSMLMILPAIIEKDQITIGILPFTSLIMDYSRKLQQLAVPFEVYKSNSKLHGHQNLILVSADMVKTPRWRQEIMQLNERRPVVRMVFDEGHLAFTANSYRKSLQDLYNLRQFPCQIVVLSGTIPPQSQDLVVDSYGLINPFVVRTSSNRPEIRYILEEPLSNSGAIIARVQEIVTAYQIDFDNPEDRYLIFVPYIEEGHKISKALGIDFYYTGKSKEQHHVDSRQQYYDAWFQGKKKGMVCTSAFGAGNDYGHVRMIIHAGTPKEMIGYVQESGRGGRDGSPVSCYILPKKDKGKEVDIGEDEDHQGFQAMHSLIYKSPSMDCIRFKITSFCDPTGIHCLDDPKNQLCSECLDSTTAHFSQPDKHHHDGTMPSSSLKRSLCNAFGQAYQESKAKRIEKVQSPRRYVELFHQALSFYIGNCAYCLALGVSRRETSHRLVKCPALNQQMDYYKALQEDLKYQDYHPSICWKCHVPQCHDQLHPEFVIGHEACEFKDIILPVVTAAFVVKKKEVSREFGGKWDNVLHAVEWFNAQPINGHQSNLTAVFLWYYYDHQKHT